MMKTQHCVICGISEEVEPLASGPIFSICKQCLGLIAYRMLARAKQNIEYPAGWSHDKHWYCCGCGASNDEAQLLVELDESSHDCICNKCVIDGIVYLLSNLPIHGTPIQLQVNGIHAE